MLPWEKVVLIFLHEKLIGLAFMGKYYSIFLMLFNLAFLMKCKYYIIKSDSFSKENIKDI